MTTSQVLPLLARLAEAMQQPVMAAQSEKAPSAPRASRDTRITRVAQETTDDD